MKNIFLLFSILVLFNSSCSKDNGEIDTPPFERPCPRNVTDWNCFLDVRIGEWVSVCCGEPAHRFIIVNDSIIRHTFFSLEGDFIEDLYTVNGNEFIVSTIRAADSYYNSETKEISFRILGDWVTFQKVE